MLQIDDSKHEFEQGDDCPFCDGHLEPGNKGLECTDKKCWFNKVTWESK